MSRRKVDTFGDLAAAGRRVVCSTGSLDGALFQALAKVQLVPNGTIGEPSTWGPGVDQDGKNDSDNSGLSEGGTDGADQVTR